MSTTIAKPDYWKHDLVPGGEQKDLNTLNLGPTHPATHGIFQNVLTMDGEVIQSAEHGSTLVVDNTFFHNDLVGIQVPNTYSDNPTTLVVRNNVFYSFGTLKQPYPGQTTSVGTVGRAGIDASSITLDLSSSGNFFHHLSNGIITDRCDVYMTDCWFEDIQPDATYAHHANGAGIYCRGISGLLTLKQQGFGMNGMHSFRDCRWGIYTDGMSVHSTENNMQQVGTGYRVDRSGYFNVDILRNRVNSWFNGIDLRFNDGIAHLLVEDNTVTFGSFVTGGRGHSAILVAEGNINNLSSSIQYNTIHYRSGAATAVNGINLVSANDYYVMGNTLHMTDNAVNFAGIITRGCGRPNISCNTVEGSFNNYGVNLGQSAIRNNLGNNPRITCNTVDGTTNGLLFTGNAFQADVGGNNLHNHRWPLHLDGTAIIGTQTLRGNLWYPNNVPGNLGAWYEDLINAQNNPFEYSLATIAGGSTLPYSIDPAAGWFSSMPGQNFECGASGYCTTFMHETCEECKTELDERIAADELENDPYTEETKWMLKGDLFEKLMKAPELLDMEADLADFYEAMEATTVGQFKFINADYLDLFDLDPAVRAALLTNRAQIEALMPQLETATEQLTDPDLTAAARAALTTTIAGLKSNIESLLGLNAQALELAVSGRSLNADNVKAANNDIATTELIEENTREVNELYLSTIAKDVDGFTTAEAAQLFDIANQCPMRGGNAVYRARAMYSLVDDDQDFDDAALCLAQGLIYRGMEQGDRLPITIMPNPATDMATLVFSLNEDASGTLVFYDTIGHETMRLTLSGGGDRHPFSTRDLGPGAYHYVVFNGAGLAGEGNLIIVR